MRAAALALAGVLLVAASRPAAAEMIEKKGTFGGLNVTYKVVLPDGFDPAKAYPAVLVFTGGPQTLQMAGNTLEADWRREGEKRGYLLFSPGTPDGNLFFESADRIFPEFLDRIQKDYKIAGKLHIAGHSNGGLSAFHVAAKYPQYFSTLTGYPGLLDGPDRAKTAVIKPFCIFMHVGDKDDGWRPAMQEQAEMLKRQGYRIQIAVEKNQVHRLKAAEINLQVRLFDEIESCK